jgi:hypothetical protein
VSNKPRWMTWTMLCAGVGLLAGCTLMGGRVAWVSDKPPAQSEPNIDDQDEDKWSFVGKEARGHRTLDDERDPLKKYLMSDEARRIERNLGYK